MVRPSLARVQPRRLHRAPRGVRILDASQRLALVGFTYGEGEAEAEEPAEALAEEVLVEGALAEVALAEETFADDALAGAAPVWPALIVRTMGALGRALVPAEGSVPVTVPYSSGPCTDWMAATL
jgi:hypothetical protein